MMELTAGEFVYLAYCLGGFFFGLYSGIFVLYLQYYASQEGKKAINILFYALCVLYVLSMALLMINIVDVFVDNVNLLYHLEVTAGTLFTCCDFIAQSILLYRCWIVWGCNIRVMIIPLILELAYIIISIMADTTPPVPTAQGQFFSPDWGNTLLALSMSVNALATGLIVFKIFKVFREVKTTAGNQNLGANGGGALRRAIFIIIESGMVLYSIQMAQLVVGTVTTNAAYNDAAYNAYVLIIRLHEVLNGITPTVILVRVSMGLTFHDENSLVEISTGSLRFAPVGDDPNPISETEDIADQERRDDDIGIELSDDSDIRMVER